MIFFYISMFGTRANSWKFGHLQSTGIILQDMAMNPASFHINGQTKWYYFFH